MSWDTPISVNIIKYHIQYKSKFSSLSFYCDHDRIYPLSQCCYFLFHRSVLDNQLFDHVRMVEEECLLSVNVKDESKENLIRAVIGKMVTL